MQPIIRFSMLRSRERSTLAAFRSQKRFPPFFLKIALKANKRFFFFPFLSLFVSFCSLRTQETALRSAGDQSRKIKDSSESPSVGWRVRVSRTARGSPIEEGKYRDTHERVGLRRVVRESTIPRPRVRFRFPSLSPLSLYACDLCLLGRESRTDTARESSSGSLETFLSYENIYPQLEASPRATYSSSTHASSSTFRRTTHAVHLFFAFRRRDVATPLTHTWQQHRAATNLRYYLYLVSVKFPR